MVRILVLGATGYIGLATCQELRRHSHIVYGLARSAEKAKLLLQNEIIPIIGTVEGGEYLSTVVSANIDIVIDTAATNDGGYKILSDLREIGRARLTSRGPGSPKLGFIYTGGTWVHGTGAGARLNDLNPVGEAVVGDPGCPHPPPALVAWRPVFEQAVLAARDDLDTLVVRPAVVYGRGSHVLSLLFGALAKAAETNAPSVELPADRAAIISLIHVDEVANALRCAAERLSLVSSNSSVYPVFDAVTSREPLAPILAAAAVAFGYKGEVKLVEPTEDFPKALSTSARLDSTRLRDLLGWKSPRMVGLLDEIEVLVASWKASNL